MPLPKAPVGASLHAACAARRPYALPSPGPHLAHCIRFLCSRQSAKTFNQSLSVNTSSVTDMSYMFQVRSACALLPVSSLRLLARYQTPHVAPLSPVFGARLALHPGLFTCSKLTRQIASAFNQPLSLDTSSVTTMSYMFEARSARALPPVSSLRLLAR